MRRSGGGGTRSSAHATTAATRSRNTDTEATRDRRISCCCGREPRVNVTRGAASSGALELHLGRGLAPRRRLEVRLVLEASERRDDAGGEEADPCVVVAHRLVVAAALDGDAILGAFELALQRQEVLVRLEV